MFIAVFTRFDCIRIRVYYSMMDAPIWATRRCIYKSDHYLSDDKLFELEARWAAVIVDELFQIILGFRDQNKREKKRGMDADFHLLS